MKSVPRSAGTSVYIALLRAVNVGGNNKLPMRDLAEIFSAAGAAAVRTYIQSGNVVFSAPAAVAGKLPGSVPKLIAKRFGFEPPLVLRSAQQLARIAADNPFLDGNADVSSLYVGFLADPPESERAAKLNPERSPGDRFALVGQEIYMQLAAGAADTKLTTSYFDSTLATTSTFRNWRTVLKLVELTHEMQRCRSVK